MAQTTPPTDGFEQPTFPGVLREMWSPEITHGPVSVHINLSHRLIVIGHCADLIAALSSAECKQLEKRLQDILNEWAKMKNLPHN